MNAFALIFESIGTQELILIGIVALIFLGPRKLPDIARKAGKIMNDLRSTTNEFKTTWEREVNFEDESRALREALDETDGVKTIPKTPVIAAPAITEIDTDRFERMKGETAAAADTSAGGESTEETKPTKPADTEKRSWL